MLVLKQNSSRYVKNCPKMKQMASVKMYSKDGIFQTRVSKCIPKMAFFKLECENVFQRWHFEN